MEIENRKSFNNLIKSLTEEILDEEELDEMNTTASVGGEYMTPMAFTGGKKKKFITEIETEKSAKKDDLIDKPAEEND